MVNQYKLVKINKRLFIVDPNQEEFYSPPDFLYYKRGFNARDQLTKLINQINSMKEPITDLFNQIIFDFEGNFDNKRKR